MRRTKAERTEQQNNSRLEISGVLLLALGCFAAAAYFGLPTGTIGAFIDKVMNYTLGKGAFLFPLACIVLGIRFSFSHKELVFSKKVSPNIIDAVPFRHSSSCFCTCRGRAGS